MTHIYLESPEGRMKYIDNTHIYAEAVNFKPAFKVRNTDKKDFVPAEGLPIYLFNKVATDQMRESEAQSLTQTALCLIDRHTRGVLGRTYQMTTTDANRLEAYSNMLEIMRLQVKAKQLPAWVVDTTVEMNSAILDSLDTVFEDLVEKDVDFEGSLPEILEFAEEYSGLFNDHARFRPFNHSYEFMGMIFDADEEVTAVTEWFDTAILYQLMIQTDSFEKKTEKVNFSFDEYRMIEVVDRVEDVLLGSMFKAL